MRMLLVALAELMTSFASTADLTYFLLLLSSSCDCGLHHHRSPALGHSAVVVVGAMESEEVGRRRGRRGPR